MDCFIFLMGFNKRRMEERRMAERNKWKETNKQIDQKTKKDKNLK